MAEDVEIRCVSKFNSIRFCSTERGNLALAEGTFQAGDDSGLFGLALAPKPDGEWLLKETRSTASIKDFVNTQEVLQVLVNRAGKLLEPVNIWPSESSNHEGALLSLNLKLAPPEVSHKVCISYRPNMLSLPTSNWEHLWTMIEGRVQADNYFTVQGFSKNDITMAIEELKLLFHSDWVRARYQATSNQNCIPKMAEDFPPDSEYWFPSYHFARTALGSMCIDPGWNYLVEIGLSIRELKNFDGLEKLKRQLMRSPGTQHHLCLAAELYRRGFLVALEPATGSGNYTNDLLAKINETEYHIEVKEFSSKNPGNQLRKEIRKKSEALPNTPAGPVIFHAVLLEDGVFNKGKEEQFLVRLMD